MSAGNVRREFRRVIAPAGLVAAEWTPRETRRGFVSLLSAGGMALEHISRLVGHKGTVVTETVYRKQIRPVIEESVQSDARDRRHGRGQRRYIPRDTRVTPARDM